ncbi:hypothetical protein ABWK46_14650, partial [Peribacillus frigoritolerans]|uniref:hypothetical protein n=1 Tax=Peribacillus frigoritolerans TaxID=450367 RepID=UPI0033972D19
FQMINLMWKHNICIDEYKEEIQSLRYICVHLQDQFAEKPEWLKEQSTLRSLSSKVDSVTKQIEEAVKPKWEEFVEKNLPSIHNDMLGIMENIPSFSTKVKKIKQLYRDISAQKVLIPVQEKVLLAIVKQKQELTQEWNSLGAEDVPSAVLTFIRSASSPQGASLLYLTPEVLAWLKQYNIQSFFKIRL